MQQQRKRTAKLTAIAEARLMRACAYFYMVRLWGPVIIIEDNDKVVANPIQPLHREEDVFELVIRDLTFAAENLPEVPMAKGRVSSWGAKGMLAKATLPVLDGKEVHETIQTWNWQKDSSRRDREQRNRPLRPLRRPLQIQT